MFHSSNSTFNGLITLEPTWLPEPEVQCCWNSVFWGSINVRVFWFVCACTCVCVCVFNMQSPGFWHGERILGANLLCEYSYTFLFRKRAVIILRLVLFAHWSWFLKKEPYSIWELIAKPQEFQQQILLQE